MRRDGAKSDTRFPMYGGRLCLNLIATVGKRHVAPYERLPDVDALVDWLRLAGLVPDDAGVVVENGRLDAVRELREVTNRLVRAVMAGVVPEAGDVAKLNDVAAGPDLAPRLRGDLSRGRVWGGDPVGAAMATLARDAVELLSGPRTARIKECEHPDCSLLFFDDSQPGRRRWCSMERCGNRVKIAGYRGRAQLK